jgi:hypothetical protein
MFEHGFSVRRPRASGAHAQPPAEPPASATMEGGQDDISQLPSPFFFSSPIPGDPFSQTYLLLFRHFSSSSD